jgi:serine/threonine-protein kinase
VPVPALLGAARRRATPVLGLGFVLGALVASHPALADEAADRAAADALFIEGRQLVTEGKLEAGCAKLAESQRLDPAPGTQLNLAACLEKRGLWASAWTTYRDAAAAARREGRTAWAAEAEATAARVALSMATLEIRVDAREPLDSLEVRRDGALLARAAWNDKLPIDPGPHEISVSSPDRKAWRTTVTIPPKADAIVVQVPLLEPLTPGAPVAPAPVAAVAPAEAPATTSAAADPSTRRIAGYALAGVGAVALGLGAVLGLEALSKNSDATDRCHTAGACTDPTGVSLSDQARGLGNASTITLAAGAALAATGVVLVVLSPRRAEAPRVGLVLGPGHAALEGAF